MTVYSNYPDICPEHGRYLPCDSWRDNISIPIEVTKPYFLQMMGLNKYGKDEMTLRNVVVASLEGILEQIKEKALGYYKKKDEKEKSFQILEDAYQTVVTSIPENPLLRNISTYLATIMGSWADGVFEQQPSREFKLSSEDFKIAGMSQDNYEANERYPVCYDYAFHQLNEQNAFPFLFDAKGFQWPLELFTNPTQFLPTWGYQLVDTPEPGDLVAYCCTLNDAPLEVRHWAIWKEDGQCESKMGKGVYRHPIERVPLEYGNFVYFFRKQVKSAYVQQFLKELGKLPSITKETVIDLAQNVEVKGVLPGSLYGEDYNRRARELVLQKLQEITSQDDLSHSLIASSVSSIGM